jgi:hypothetical protein
MSDLLKVKRERWTEYEVWGDPFLVDTVVANLSGVRIPTDV